MQADHWELHVWLQVLDRLPAVSCFQGNQAPDPQADSQVEVLIYTAGLSAVCDWEMVQPETAVVAVERVVAEVGVQDLTDTADATAAVERWDTEQLEPGLLHSWDEEGMETEVPKMHCHTDLMSETKHR